MKRYRPEQIVEKLRQADVELGQGHPVKEVCRKLEVSEQTYYRCRASFESLGSHGPCFGLRPRLPLG